MRRMKTYTLVVLVCLGLACVHTASAEDDAEKVVNAAVKKQNQALRDAQRAGGGVGPVVARAKARLARQGNVLNLYLLGRATYYSALEDLRKAITVAQGKQPQEAKQREFKALQSQARAKAESAIGLLQQVLQSAPRFWWADRGLARLYLETNRVDLAYTHIRKALAIKPRDPRNLEVALGIAQQQKRWAAAEAHARLLIELEPANSEFRLSLIGIFVQQAKIDAAIKELEPLVRAAPGRADLRYQLAGLIIQHAMRPVPQGGKPIAGEIRKAVNHLWQVLRLRPNAYPIMGLLEEAYVNLILLENGPKDRQRLEELLNRMTAIAPGPKERARVDNNLKRLRSGEQLGNVPKREVSPQNEVVRLIEIALDNPDRVKRAEALQQLLDMRLAEIPRALYSRLSASLEPCPICRSLIVRLLGQLEIVPAIRHLARGLQDADMQVRVVAADELARYTHKGVATYIEPLFFNLRLAPLPTERAAQKSLRREYNALRNALHSHTQFRDRELMAEGDIKLEAMAANRKRWQDFFRSERGIQVLLDSLKVFGELNDPYPERYVLLRVIGTNEDLRVRNAALAVLNDWDAQITADAKHIMRERYRSFPRYAEITDANLVEVRAAMLKWYKSL